ncbi:MAG: hypothetical protein O2954_00055 [bacterium]|nr:hypothetical protein [bacterium]
MSFELITFLVCLACLFSTLAAKYLVTVRTFRFRERLHAAEAGVVDLRKQLKVIDNDHAVLLNKEKSLTNQKTRLEKRIPGLRKELTELSD